MYKITTIILSILLAGCSPKIVQYDPENDPTDIGQYTPTEDIVTAAKKDGIVIDVFKMMPVQYRNRDELQVQHWKVVAFNTTNKDKCVGVMWKLMDFEFYTDYPTYFLVPAKDATRIGKMVGKVWVVDGVAVAPPPSGYVHHMEIRDPDYSAVKGEECMFVEED